MKRKLSFALVLAALLLSGCQNGNTVGPVAAPSSSSAGTIPNADEAGNSIASAADESSIADGPDDSDDPDAADDQYADLTKIYVHRANGFTESFDKEQFNAFDPLITNIKSIYWIAQRDGAGIDSTARAIKTESEVSVLTISTDAEPSFDGDYIRLAFLPYIPEPGQNDMGRQDLIVYQDPEHKENAYLGVQNPKNTAEWTIFDLPGYGAWLSTELAIILRDGFGF